MIADEIGNRRLYANLSSRLAEALEMLESGEPAAKEAGRYEIDGDNLYYIVQRYKTRPAEEGRFEAHKKYIDVQFVANGREMLGFSPLDNLQILTPYDKSKDVAFYKLPDKISMIKLEQGMFCILFPHDAHLPCLQLDAPSTVHKIVVKVKLDV
jgi:YhcH/YjgK/YiaL family protein